MSEQRLRVTVVTLSFNQHPFLERAMRSVLEQDYPVEYIVVDPGSTDGSREIIARFEPHLARVIFEPDTGPADGLNKAFAVATGDVFAYLNSDDVLAPGAVSRAVEALKANSDAAVVYADGWLVDVNEQRIRRFRSTRFDLRRYAYGSVNVLQPSTFIRRDAFRGVGGFNVENRTSWDAELLIDIARAGYAVEKVGGLWSLFRIHGGSISGSRRLRGEYERDHRRLFVTIVGREPSKLDRARFSIARVGKWVRDPLYLVWRLTDILRYRNGGFVGMRARTRSPAQSFRVISVIAGLDPVIGGPPAAAVATSLALHTLGVYNEIVFLVERGGATSPQPLLDTLNRHGIDTHAFPHSRSFGPLGRRWSISRPFALWLLRNSHRYDIVHVHAAWTCTSVVGLLVAKLRGRAIVLTAHESLTDFDRRDSSPPARVVKRVLRAVFLRAFDAVLVASPLEQRDSGDAAGRFTRVVPHAVRRVSMRPRSARDAFAVGFLGRLHPKKNLPLLLAAVAGAEGDIETVVAGDGPPGYRTELRQLAAELGVGDRVTWLGFVDAETRSEFFGSIDVLAMPSDYECFGIAAVEAMTAGVPVVVTPTVGVANVVESYGAGLVAAPTAEAFAEAVARLARDPDLRAACSAAAKAAAEEEFSTERHGQRVLSVYLEITKGRRSRRLPLAEVRA